MPHAYSKERRVYLPLQSLDKCSVCGATETIRWCSRCGERLYCGQNCQAVDWPEHKRICGETERISLTSFYPFLAVLAEVNRMHPNRPINPGLTHEILNSPNPGALPTAFPDGSSANLIMLGNRIPLEAFGSPRWWPTARTEGIRDKLKYRLFREGNALSLLTSLALALLSEMYTTTHVPRGAAPDGQARARLRLRYRSAPIADFGIARGAADVKTQDRFAYFSALEERFWMGEDPGEHYWIYFRTVAGEEVTLDLGMFAFNMCMLVPDVPYRNRHCLPVQCAPAYFYDREMQRHVIPLTQEHARASVLRDPALHQAIRHNATEMGGFGVRVVQQFMERIAGKKITREEVDLTMKWTVDNMRALGTTLADRDFANFPETPPLSIEADPGEMDDDPGAANNDWYQFAAKWTKKFKQGKISREALGEAHRAWKSHVKCD